MAVEPKELPQFIDHDELINLLPHKGKMFLLSRTTAHDVENHTITNEYDITENCIFYEPEYDGVPTWAGFELMAQGISALTGITNKIKGREPLPGMILSVVDFKSTVGYSYFCVGAAEGYSWKYAVGGTDLYQIAEITP